MAVSSTHRPTWKHLVSEFNATQISSSSSSSVLIKDMIDEESTRNTDNGKSITPTPVKHSPAPISPKMSRLFGSPNSESTVVSFFGDIDFLDNQSTFDEVFGKDPVLFNVHLTSGGVAACLKKVRTYADKLMLDIFLDIFRDNYVVGEDKVSKSKLVHEICKELELLSQFDKSRNTEVTPGELFAKFLSIIASLPGDTTQ